MQRTLTYLFFSLFLFFAACRQTNKIVLDSVDNIELVQVDHPYIGHHIDSKKLESKLVADFLNDFADRKENISKFYSCYVIKIHLKNGQLISYRTNGHEFEKLIDSTQQKNYFQLNSDINLVTKYWGIQKEQFCDTTKIKNGL